MANRISQSFAAAQQAGRGILGVFVSAGDPSEALCVDILDEIVAGGADYRAWYAGLIRWQMARHSRLTLSKQA